jgi:hypothetical protein
LLDESILVWLRVVSEDGSQVFTGRGFRPQAEELVVVFFELGAKQFKKEGLVALTGIEPVFQP